MGDEPLPTRTASIPGKENLESLNCFRLRCSQLKVVIKTLCLRVDYKVIAYGIFRGVFGYYFVIYLTS